MLSPTLFLNGVLGLIRIGKQARNAYAESVLRRETLVHFIPQFGDAVFSARNSREWAAAFIRERRTGRYFDQLFIIEHGAPTPRFPLTAPEWDAAFDAVSRELGLFAPKDVPDAGFPVPIKSPAMVLTHHEWFKDTNAPWGRFGLAVADAALDFLSQEPELLGPGGLGLGQETRRVANALLPNLADALRPELYSGGEKGIGESLGVALFQAALETVVEDPTLVTSKEHWRPIVEAAVGSVQTQVQHTIGAGEDLFARDRVSAFVQGPFVHAIIGAVDNNVDAFLKGSFKDEKLLGQVSRNLLGHLSELTPEDADLKAFFSPRGAAMIFDSALETLAERPELIIRGTGEDVDLSRRFLTSVAGLVKDAPAPFNSADIATDIGLTVLEIGRDYALTQVMADPGDQDWDMVMSDLAQHMIGEIFGGLSDVIQPGLPGQSADGVLAKVFSRSQAISLVKMIADHVAKTPGLVIGQGGSPEVRNIARGVAQFIADDNRGLMTGDQWQDVIALALELAAQNPGALFGLEDNGTAARSIAVELIGDLLSLANTQIVEGGPVRQPGLILIGDTLQRTIEATLQAASSMALKNLNADPGSETYRAVKDFADRLLRLSQGDAAGVSLSAGEWVEVYRAFIAEIMEKGAAALDPASADYIQDGDLLSILYEFAPASPDVDVA